VPAQTQQVETELDTAKGGGGLGRMKDKGIRNKDTGLIKEKVNKDKKY